MFEPHYVYLDERFRALTLPNTQLEQLYNQCRWAEGPVWFNDGGYLLWSDIPNQRILRWTPEQGVSVFRQDSNFANGNTRDLQGRLVTCEHGPRRVTRTEPDGSITVIADRYQGKRLNSPNDVVVHRDGAIWFTDPTYGILTDYEGFKAEQEQQSQNVYRVDPISGEVQCVADDFVQPNGLAFSADGNTLYIADSARTHDLAAPTSHSSAGGDQPLSFRSFAGVRRDRTRDPRWLARRCTRERLDERGGRDSMLCS